MSNQNKSSNAKQVAQRMQENKKRFLTALEKSLGVKTPAARKIGVDPATVYRWINQDPEFAEAVKAIEEQALDFSESALFRQIADNNTSATIFHLKTKGKHRGWVERQEIVDKSAMEDQLEEMSNDELLGLMLIKSLPPRRLSDCKRFSQEGNSNTLPDSYTQTTYSNGSIDWCTNISIDGLKVKYQN